jgi:hypothetical protein
MGDIARRLRRLEAAAQAAGPTRIVCHGPSEAPEQAEARFGRENPAFRGALIVVNTGIDQRLRSWE